MQATLKFVPTLLLAACLMVLFTACGQNDNKAPQPAQQAETTAWQCPMKCEGEDKTYGQSGTCPVCKMDLKEVKVAAR